ncbi:MAG: hypothetical protein FJX60_11170 [Alphaproteobacteria bacterium]|nr:hypothetical protein [Alphaproteobacteria bacterium]
MVSSISSALVPISAIYPQSRALRPVDGGAFSEAAPGFDAEAHRQVQALRAETLREAPSQPRDGREAAADRNQQDLRSRRPDGDSAPFLAQALAQDQPPSRRRGPFAEAARAYGRFQEAPRAGFVLDTPAKVDLKV